MEVILLQDYELRSSGALKRAGTRITFASGSEELSYLIREGIAEPVYELPADLPGRRHFVDAGFSSLQDLAGLEEWTQVKGIGPKTAEELDIYFNSNKTEEE